MPTYNEAGNIVELLQRLALSAPGVDVLVVDDGSPDGTAELVRAAALRGAGVHLLQRDAKQGLGAAYRAGFGWALQRDYLVVAQMDADLSHPPELLAPLIACVDGTDGTADVAIGSRYVPGGSVENWTRRRRLLSRTGNLWVRQVLGLSVADATAGFRAFRRDALIAIGAVDSSSDGYCFQIENTWRAERTGLRVVEVPIDFCDRTAGSSKMSPRIAAEALGRSAQWRFSELIGVATPSTASTLSTTGDEANEANAS